MRIKRWKQFLEDGTAAVGAAVAGMGAVSNSQPGAFAGTAGAAGSGDLGFPLRRALKSRKKGNPSQVSDLRDLAPADTVKVLESSEPSPEDMQEIKWALIDLLDDDFSLSAKKYDDPDEVQEMTIGLFRRSLRAWGGVDAVKGKIGARDFDVEGEGSLAGEDREIVDSLEQGCESLMNSMGYDIGSFSIRNIPSGHLVDDARIHVSTHIHVHMMKQPFFRERQPSKLHYLP